MAKPLKKAKMVGWYDPRQLLGTAFEVLISTVFGRHADRCLLEALADPNDLKEKLYYDFSETGENEMWLDYISDVGDGFDSTYTMAYYLARSQLAVATPDNNQNVYSTRQGEILIFGGDEVYPTASMQAYSERLIKPYKAAFSQKMLLSPRFLPFPEITIGMTALFLSHAYFAKGSSFSVPELCRTAAISPSNSFTAGGSSEPICSSAPLLLNLRSSIFQRLWSSSYPATALFYAAPNRTGFIRRYIKMIPPSITGIWDFLKVMCCKIKQPFTSPATVTITADTKTRKRADKRLRRAGEERFCIRRTTKMFGK